MMILSAFVISLDVPYRYDWSAEHPDVSRATVLVVQVEPERLVVHDVGDPVLLVDGVPAEVLRRDPVASTMTVLVPGALGATASVWFGPAMLPERFTHEQGAAELKAAQAGGLRPLDISGKTEFRFGDHDALDRWVPMAATPGPGPDRGSGSDR